MISDVRGITESLSNELVFGFSNVPTRESQFIIVTTSGNNIPYLIVGNQFSRVDSISRAWYDSYSLSTSTGKGFHIKAKENEKISVHCRQSTGYPFYSLDFFLAINIKPTSGIQQHEYRSIPYNRLSSLLLVATEDDTVINVRSSQIVLNNRLQTHQVDSIDAFQSIVVTSNKPLSVISSKTCTVSDQSCDYLTEQLLPVHLWGKRFLVASFLGLKTREGVRILASLPSTIVTISCADSIILRTVTFIRRLWRNVLFDEKGNNRDVFCVLEATEPIYVMQYATIVNDEESYMMTIPATDQFGESFTGFYIPNLSPFNFVNIYVTPEHFSPEIVVVDGAPVLDWTTVQCPNRKICGHISRPVLLRSRYHTVHHLDPRGRIGISAYGYDTGQNSSYGYPVSMFIPSPQSKYNT